MARLVKLTDLLPLVLRQVINFALLGGIVRVLGSDSKEVVLGLELHAFV